MTEPKKPRPLPTLTRPDKPIETDAGMMPDESEKPEFRMSDYATEAEAIAALRARLGDIAFERMSGDIGFTFPADRSK